MKKILISLSLMALLCSSAWGTENSRIVSEDMRALILYEHNFPNTLPAAVLEAEVYIYGDGTMLVMTQFKKVNMFDKKDYEGFLKNVRSVVKPHKFKDEIGASILIGGKADDSLGEKYMRGHP